MKNKVAVREAFERKVQIMQRRPTVGRGTAVTKVRVIDGLQCEVEAGPWKFGVDLNESAGGSGSAPDPGTYGRGALGSCLAITYMMWASRWDIPINDLQIYIEVDYDARGMYGFEGVSPEYEGIRYRVMIDSPASNDELEEMLLDADEHCTYLKIFENAQRVDRIIRLTTSDSSANENND